MMLKFLTCSTFLLLTSCAGLSLYVPYPEVPPSEVPGSDKKLSLKFNLDRGQYVTVANDVAKRPPDIGTPKSVRAAHVSAEPSLGIGSRTQVGVTVDPLNFGFLLTGKYQPVGKNMRDAERGNFSLTLAARSGITSYDSVSGDQTYTFGPGGYPYKGSANLWMSDVAVSLGMRPFDALLVYGGLASAFYSAEIKVEQPEARNNDAPSGNYTYKQSGNAHNAVLGMLWGKEKFGVGARGGLTSFKWYALPRRLDWYAAVYFQVHQR